MVGRDFLARTSDRGGGRGFVIATALFARVAGPLVHSGLSSPLSFRVSSALRRMGAVGLNPAMSGRTLLADLASATSARATRRMRPVVARVLGASQ